MCGSAQVHQHRRLPISSNTAILISTLQGYYKDKRLCKKANSSVNCKGHANANCPFLVWSYLFSIDTPIARLALYSARLAVRRRNRAVDCKRQKRKQKEQGGC